MSSAGLWGMNCFIVLCNGKVSFFKECGRMETLVSVAPAAGFQQSRPPNVETIILLRSMIARGDSNSQILA